ncbi:TIM-barrel domain-containing protein [Salinisphaera sp.]|uniref:TIM-barrel domain-containing protein n=1 Tax=Salinisphaera sp. TaxID=1914330 RepID=UPI002D7804D4|nr:TIM-barrel domain-containing protein [Salinisphaera sp.]HET7312966.1 TIM-barrel domain-containing protein [Salinisphaera sp.]
MARSKSWIAALVAALAAVAALSGCNDSDQDDVDIQASSPQGLPSRIARLGNYEITSAAGAVQIVRDGQTVWATTAAPVTLARTTLDIGSERAIYEIEENRAQTCKGGRFTRMKGVADDVRLVGEFDDGACKGVSFSLELSSTDDGQVHFKLSSNNPKFNEVGLSLAVDENEQFHGFGEQTEQNLRGQNIPIVIQEQGVGRGGVVSKAINQLQLLPLPDDQKALIRSFVKAQGNAVTTYYAVPLTITGQGAGMLLKNTGYTRFDLRPDDHIEVHGFAGNLDGRFFGGKSQLEAITQATEYTGRMSVLPDWTQTGAVIGLQGGTETVEARYRMLKKAGVPITGLWLQDWAGARSTYGGAASMTCWNWERDDDRYPGWDKLRQELTADGVRLLGYFNPYLVSNVDKCNPGARRNLYKEARANGYLVKNSSGKPYQLTITDFDAGIVDLTNPQAFEWLKNILETQIKKNGFSGWMADFAEGLPFDTQLANGNSGRAGAAVQAMVHAGACFEPRATAVERYDAVYRQVYTRLYSELRPTLRRLRRVFARST